MGAKVSSAGETHELKSGGTDGKFKTKPRRPTDVIFLIFFSIFLTVLLGFLGYCIFNGDIFRIINGYDDCGNVCGRPTSIHRDDTRAKSCQDSSSAQKFYHIIVRSASSSKFERRCVTNCAEFKEYRTFFNRCLPSKTSKINSFFSKAGLHNFFQEVNEDFHLIWHEFLYLCLASFGFSVLILILFRFVVGVVVWVVLFGVVAALSACTAILWIVWKQSKTENALVPQEFLPEIDSRKTGTYLVFAIVATIITLAVILIIFVMRKRIQLVVQLFKESGKALASMPLLLAQPILTFVSLLCVVSLWLYFSLWVESSGHLIEESGAYSYQKDFWMKFTRWYNLLAMLWMCQFVIGCQHLVIAGAVSTWYFSRPNEKIDSPIFKGFYNLVRYHLGSVALGSFIIALVQFLRAILKALEGYLSSHRGKCVDCLLKCCQCCLYCFEKILKYLTRNAYIEVAMYGCSFCKGGRQAFKLLVSNALRVTAINSVGDFVLFLGKVLVLAATVLVGLKFLEKKDGLQHMWVPIVMAGLFGFFIAHCFMTVYEMCIDTIFLCFCEDCEQNDGVTRPYFMSKGLMEFVENSKKALKIQDGHQSAKVGSISEKVT